MRLTYKFRYYPKSGHLKRLCQISKNLYNQANYLVRQELQQANTWIRYSQLNHQLKVSSLNYRLLKAQTAQQILRVVDKNWSPFLKQSKTRNRIRPNIEANSIRLAINRKMSSFSSSLLIKIVRFTPTGRSF